MAGAPQEQSGADDSADDVDVNEGGDHEAGGHEAGGHASDEPPPSSPEAGTVRSTPTDLAPDSRVSRPEPFEHTFGAHAHPAEVTAKDPSHTAPAVPSAPRDAQPGTESTGPSDPSSEQ